jgi:hypothetical protein
MPSGLGALLGAHRRHHERVNRKREDFEDARSGFAWGGRRMMPGQRDLEFSSRDSVEVVCESAVRLSEHGVVDEASVEDEVDAVGDDSPWQ